MIETFKISRSMPYWVATQLIREWMKGKRIKDIYQYPGDDNTVWQYDVRYEDDQGIVL